MIRALWTAATGMGTQQINLDVISNNLANINTIGFKKARAEFQDLLYQETKKSGKSIADCICPGCGKVHLMKIQWTGRGMCRKFCESCRSRQTPVDREHDR